MRVKVCGLGLGSLKKLLLGCVGKARWLGSARTYLRKNLRLEVHPDKYRALRTDVGVDFCGFVLRSDGRIKIRKASVRRFQQRHKKLKFLGQAGKLTDEQILQHQKAWMAHASHAQMGLLRELCVS